MMPHAFRAANRAMATARREIQFARRAMSLALSDWPTMIAELADLMPQVDSAHAATYGGAPCLVRPASS